MASSGTARIVNNGSSLVLILTGNYSQVETNYWLYDKVVYRRRNLATIF